MPASLTATAPASRLLDPQRLRRIRNIQSAEFYSRLVMRPLSTLVLIFVADWKWLTPNLVTTFANVFKLAGAALIAFNHQDHGVLGAIVLQIGTLFDHIDGMLARYRGAGSVFGAFYDKASDAVTWLVISGALGWAAYKDTGDVWLPIGAVASAYMLLVIGYMKWIVAAASRRTPAPAAQEPPSRTPAQWAGWFVSSLARAAMFEEIDLFFWIGLGLVLDELPFTILLLVVSQAVQLVIMCIKRALQMRAIDAEAAAATARRAA
ncbi:MAG TPA: CDP-alcohol phosphatidyltransferase family protein [Kofleriaceae bacterium]|nr:CDP-alcohol phosphatidyltransferase family protein [Kofleriaceae bacterium]